MDKRRSITGENFICSTIWSIRMWWMAKAGHTLESGLQMLNVHLIGDFTNWYGEQIPG